MILPTTHCHKNTSKRLATGTTSLKRPALILLAITVLGVSGCGGGTVWRSDVPQDQRNSNTTTQFPQNPDRRNSTITSEAITDGSSQANFDPDSPESLEPRVYLFRAEQAQSPERESLLLDAVGAMLDRDAIDDAIAQLGKLDASQLPPELGLRRRIAMARIEAERVGPDSAINSLQVIANNTAASASVQAEALLALSQVQSTMAMPIEAANALLRRSRLLSRDGNFEFEQRERNSFAIWRYLSQPDIVTLRRARNAVEDAESSAWYELAEIHRLYDRNPDQKNLALDTPTTPSISALVPMSNLQPGHRVRSACCCQCHRVSVNRRKLCMTDLYPCTNRTAARIGQI